MDVFLCGMIFNSLDLQQNLVNHLKFRFMLSFNQTSDCIKAFTLYKMLIENFLVQLNQESKSQNTAVKNSDSIEPYAEFKEDCKFWTCFLSIIHHSVDIIHKLKVCQVIFPVMLGNYFEFKCRCQNILDCFNAVYTFQSEITWNHLVCISFN